MEPLPSIDPCYVHLMFANEGCCRFDYDSSVHIVPDFDGVRLFTSEVCEFLQNVPGQRPPLPPSMQMILTLSRCD